MNLPFCWFLAIWLIVEVDYYLILRFPLETHNFTLHGFFCLWLIVEVNCYLFLLHFQMVSIETANLVIISLSAALPILFLSQKKRSRLGSLFVLSISLIT